MRGGGLGGASIQVAGSQARTNIRLDNAMIDLGDKRHNAVSTVPGGKRRQPVQVRAKLEAGVSGLI